MKIETCNECKHFVHHCICTDFGLSLVRCGHCGLKSTYIKQKNCGNFVKTDVKQRNKTYHALQFIERMEKQIATDGMNLEVLKNVILDVKNSNNS